MRQSSPSNAQKRRNFYIDKNFQTKFIVKFSLLVSLGACLMIGLLYWLARSSTSVAIVKSRVVVMTTADFILPLLLQTVIVVSIFVSIAAVFVTLFVSHQIAGPLYRFKQTFIAMTQGNLLCQVSLRKNDQLHEVARELNQMISVLRLEIEASQKQLVQIRNSADTIGEAGVHEDRRQQFHELKARLQELEKNLNFFKV
jgi:methyl-accepting chemotaxis protein